MLDPTKPTVSSAAQKYISPGNSQTQPFSVFSSPAQLPRYNDKSLSLKASTLPFGSSVIEGNSAHHIHEEIIASDYESSTDDDSDEDEIEGNSNTDAKAVDRQDIPNISTQSNVKRNPSIPVTSEQVSKIVEASSDKQLLSESKAQPYLEPKLGQQTDKMQQSLQQQTILQPKRSTPNISLRHQSKSISKTCRKNTSKASCGRDVPESETESDFDSSGTDPMTIVCF